MRAQKVQTGFFQRYYQIIKLSNPNHGNLNSEKLESRQLISKPISLTAPGREDVRYRV